MKKKILAIAILGSISISAFAQSSSPQSNSDLEINAVVEAGCDLTADNINFGVLMMPIQDISVQSRMKVKCSKNVSMTFNINYSGQGGTTASNLTLKINASDATSANYVIYSDGKPLFSDNPYGDFQCGGSNSTSFKYYTHIRSQVAADLLGGVVGWNEPNSLSIPLCSSNRANEAAISLLSVSSKGSLIGLSSAEKIVYYVEKPNDQTVWNTSNKYTAISNGLEQIIPMKANIKRVDNETHRMTPDTYQSTLTVELVY